MRLVAHAALTACATAVGQCGLLAAAARAPPGEHRCPWPPPPRVLPPASAAARAAAPPG